MTSTTIALGSNLADRSGNLQRALDLMPGRGILPLDVSAVWETVPFPPGQPPFLNAVTVADTGLEPERLLHALKTVEVELGRRPGQRWGPRPIDLDILFVGEDRWDAPDLVIPHPRVAERAFVLAPLAEVHRGKLPVLGAPALELLQVTGVDGIRRTSIVLRIQAQDQGFSHG